MEKQAIYRYLGGAASEPQLDEMIARAEAEVKRAAAPRYVDGRFPLSVAAEGVTIGGTYLASKTLASHLRGCQEAFLTAFTLGPGIDVLIKRYELMEMPLVPVLQACAAACFLFRRAGSPVHRRVCSEEAACASVRRQFAAKRPPAGLPVRVPRAAAISSGRRRA